jgi:hypothetical protein
MAMAFQTIIQFTYIEFDKNWDQVPGGLYFWYTASADAQLLVLRDDPTGLKTTYTFKLAKGAMVEVSWNVNLVYIAARCTKSASGDKTACAPKG